jgi:hypothetical protein
MERRGGDPGRQRPGFKVAEFHALIAVMVRVLLKN